MPPSGVDYASRFLNGYAPEYVSEIINTIMLIYIELKEESLVHKNDYKTILYFPLYASLINYDIARGKYV